MKNKLYEKYHSGTRLQKKVISKCNFTYRNFIIILDKYFRNSNTILDIGCGVGTIDFYLAQKGHKIVGLDISKTAIDIANKNSDFLEIHNTNFIYSDIKKYKTKIKFDGILCSEIIEHVQDDQKTIKKMSLLLKKEGILILSTPLETAPLYKLGLTKRFDKRVGHIRRYNFLRLRTLLEQNGFRITKIVYQEGIFRNSLFVFKIFDSVVKVANRLCIISDMFTTIDNISINLFGPSDICIIGKKK